MFQPPQQSQQPDEHIREYFGPCEGSAQFKESFAVVMVLTKVPEPMNLFSDSLYVVNLLPGLLNSHIWLDNNPFSRHEPVAATTGRRLFNASKMGIPKPSYRDG